LNAANTTPHPKPVITDKNISFKSTLFFANIVFYIHL
jgi:ethanolamine utilization protein EutA (predicted chaperonin)